MLTIEIQDEVETKQDMIYLLEEVIRNLKNGCSSGYYPTWTLYGTEEE